MAEGQRRAVVDVVPSVLASARRLRARRWRSARASWWRPRSPSRSAPSAARSRPSARPAETAAAGARGRPGSARSTCSCPERPGRRLLSLLPRAAPSSEQAIVAVVLEAYIHGVSTGKVDRLVEQLGVQGMGKDRISALCRGLDAQVATFRSRPLEGEYPTCSSTPSCATRRCRIGRDARPRRRGLSRQPG